MEDIVKHHNVEDWFRLVCQMAHQNHEQTTHQPIVAMLWRRTLIADFQTESYIRGSVSSLASSFRSFILLEMTVAFLHHQ